MTRRIFSVILTFALLLALLAGCSQTSSGGDGSAGGRKANSSAAMILVGISMTGEDESVKAGEHLQSALEEAGHTVELAYADSAESQSRQISAMVEDGAAILVVDPLDSMQVRKTLESITVDVSDVAVIAYRSPISASSVDAYVGPDFYEMGQQQAQHVVDRLGLKAPETDPADEAAEGDASAAASAPAQEAAHAQVNGANAVSVEFIAGNGAEKALEGALSVLQPYLDAGLVEIPSGNRTAESCFTEDAAGRTAELCSRTYSDRELDAVLCLGENQAETVTDTLLTSYTGACFPVVTGYGCSPAALQYMSSRLLSMVSVCSADDLSQLAVDAVAAATDRTRAADSLISCTAVTLDNYEEVLIDSGLYTANEDGSFGKN